MRDDISVHVDADNVSVTAIPHILDCLAPTWTPTIRKAFGIGLVQKQTKILHENGFEAIEVVRNVPRKNSTDISLVCSLMEEYFLGRVKGMALVTSDSDFTAPVRYIRDHGLPIFVFGNEKTPPSLQSAATQFYILRRPEYKPAIGLAPIPGDYDPELRMKIATLVEDFSAVTVTPTLAKFGTFLKNRDPSFTTRYSARSLSTLLKRLGGFILTEIRTDTGVLADYRLGLARPRPTAIDLESRIQIGSVV
jgi:hypothetical protein